jgi:hypothetical protein
MFVMHDPMLNQGARIFDALSSTVPLFDAAIEKETWFIIHKAFSYFSV